MNYLDSVFDFFKPQRWFSNMLLGGVCLLIPAVGPIVLQGWHVTGFFGRPNWQDKSSYPDFDFNNFSLYLQRGVWPFLTQLVASLCFVPVMFIVSFLPMIGLPLAAGVHEHANSREGGLIVGGAFFILMVLIMLVVCPLMFMLISALKVSATITQEFGAAFNWAFIKRFIATTWLEHLLCFIFVILASIGLVLAGMMACFVGVYFTSSIIPFTMQHLERQLYDLYLARGGAPLPLSPKLSTVPPGLPPAAV